MHPSGAQAIQHETSPSQTDLRSSPKRRRSVEDNKPSGGPITFFLKSEEELAGTPSNSSQQLESTFGVHSLGETTDENESSEIHHRSEVSQISTDISGRSSEQIENPQVPTVEASAAQSPSESSPSRSPANQNVNYANKKKLTLPIPSAFNNALSADSSASSPPRSVSLRSIRLSDDEAGGDEASSQAIASSGDEEEDEQRQGEIFPGNQRHSIVDAVTRGFSDESSIQLVMPSIRMPSRRPFTERGKYMGKLKVMLAGCQQSGKTSLIKSIIQACEDIVHVDPTPNLSKRPAFNSAQRPSSRNESVLRFMETNASTRPYPSWWSNMDNSRLLRRTSSTDTILDRNMCFIDTIGSPNSATNECAESISMYLEDLLDRNMSLSSLSDGEILDVLSGNGGVQVDLLLYLLHDPAFAETEVQTIASLSRFTTVVPVISHADKYSDDELQSRRSYWQEKLNESSLASSLGDEQPSGLEALMKRTRILAISSAPSSDDDNMDASLLMSSEYIQPLVQSDLQQLVANVFHPDATARLRHISARKFISWRRNYSSNTLSQGQRRATALPLPTFHQASTSSPLMSQRSTSYSAGTTEANFPLPSYTLARINDHTQQEERLAQVHLARWASGLQRALQNERKRFASLQDAERTSWLQKRLEERINTDNTAGSVDTDVDSFLTKREARKDRLPSWSRASLVDPNDPLGLIDWNQRLMNNSLAILQVVGGAGVVGALVVWIVRAWGWDEGSEMEGSFAEMLWPWSR